MTQMRYSHAHPFTSNSAEHRLASTTMAMSKIMAQAYPSVPGRGATRNVFLPASALCSMRTTFTHAAQSLDLCIGRSLKCRADTFAWLASVSAASYGLGFRNKKFRSSVQSCYAHFEDLQSEFLESQSNPFSYDGASGVRTSLERPAVYVVATPIGNLGDITLRAIDVLRHADVLFAEDSRTTCQLLKCLGVNLNDRPLLSCHKFNEKHAAAAILRHLRQNKCVALVSDAGTPLVSDPGFVVLQHIQDEMSNCPVRPVPGACAAIAALSVAAVPTDCCLFAGFLPAKSTAKRSQLKSLLRQARSGSPATLVLYEAPHRILDTMECIADELEQEGTSAERHVVICRELTKRHETILRGNARHVLSEIHGDANNQKGEFVILVTGDTKQSPELLDSRFDARDVMRLLERELPKNRAAAISAKICGVSKKELLDSSSAVSNPGS
eukprot:TRINITY_DN72908_c0_g1_i1.p1 TRINITY_DN72908_c0_g1~~TRINITY_DN72908_c0_g1_i1.p1  ORF type:complete len:441 (-),score=55.13 TRINITY_DN72908_c0_g1_i1:420-1742(-)